MGDRIDPHLKNQVIAVLSNGKRESLRCACNNAIHRLEMHRAKRLARLADAYQQNKR